MPYTPSVFVDDSTAVPLSATELNKLGNGVQTATATAEAALAAVPDLHISTTAPSNPVANTTIWLDIS